jgi:MoaA/NifB/PqqE/SkfB family radical SAM enzyme
VHRSARNGFEAESPASFDLRMGNLCNLKCRMCTAAFSSQIEKDPVQSRWRPHEDPEKRQPRFRVEDGEDWSESRELLEELKSLGDRIEQIQLAGGEPTLNRTQTEWLRHLAETGRARRIDILVWTNMTNVRDEYFQMLSEFQSASLCLSVDGFGSTYDYIRYPARWSEFEKNVARAARYPRIAMTVVPVLQAYNILDITDLYRWADDHGLHCQINPLDGPPYLRSDVLPLKARLLARQRIDAYLAAVRRRPGFDADFVASLEGFGRQIAEPGYEATAEMIAAFWQYTREIDESRGQSLRESCPELFALMIEGRDPQLALEAALQARAGARP